MSLPPVLRTLSETVSRPGSAKTVLSLFGTRPEAIKLAPVINQLENCHGLQTINIASGQHSEILRPFIELFKIRVDKNLELMAGNPPPAELCARIVAALGLIIEKESPDLVLIQGDTTTALAGAIAGRAYGVLVGHVEAGLRSGDMMSPYPEELNRRFITRLANCHFAATPRNRTTLISEGVPENCIFLTGNPVVDALQTVLRVPGRLGTTAWGSQVIGRKFIVLTTHRRESFGELLAANLEVLCRFVARHGDISLVFPVHPNPSVSTPAQKICSGQSRVILVPPLSYRDFIELISQSWLVVSDSGGVQEEVPSLGKPLLILRENTERSECIDAGMARLVGGNPEVLMSMLEEAYLAGSWLESVHAVPNPFGNGDSGERIAQCLARLLHSPETEEKDQILFDSGRAQIVDTSIVT
jgi:UDP-N-acetylglucosamine 2-epimerase (non-hydrolysing)